MAPSIVKAFANIFKSGRKPIFIRTDQGKEFKNVTFSNFTKNEGIHHFTSNTKDVKCAIIERFNRTLKARMYKYFTAKGTRRYVDVLDDLVTAYNSSYHRSIKMRPIDVSQANGAQVFQNLYKVTTMRELIQRKAKSSLKTDDLVRKQYELKPFDKSYYPNWTDQTFNVQSVFKGVNKPVYKIDDNSKQRFYPEQVQKIKETLYRVENIIRRRTIKGKKQCYVKWLNYPNEFNSWINESDIKRL